VTDNFPQAGRGNAANQRMPYRNPADRQKVVDRGDHQRFGGQPEQVEYRARNALQMPDVTGNRDAVRHPGLDADRNQRHGQQADAEQADEGIGQQQRKERRTLIGHVAMPEDDPHRLVHCRECDRAEEDQGAEHNGTDGDLLFKKARQFVEDCGGLAGHHPVQIAPEGVQQLVRRNQLGESDDAEDQERNEGNQCVVGDGAGQQQAAVGLKVLQYAQDEAERVGEGLNSGGVVAMRHLTGGFG